MSEQAVDRSKRRFLTNLTTGVGLVGVGFAAVPFIASMMPSARARAAGAPVSADISKIEPGQMITVEWRGKPVWILNRSKAMMERLPAVEAELADPTSQESEQPVYVDPEFRSIDKSNLLVVIGICTHLGCSPDKKLEPGVESGLGADWPGGFFCPCHGSKFDLAGRVYKNVPAPTNLPVPPYSFKSDEVLVIGVDTKQGVA
jgi:ubiquinol-cytochrome c reductase iron-sulfur subunit